MATLNVVLVQPEIPPNTGNIIRLCANTGARLHLIHPLGFQLDDRALRRAGLDYHEYAAITEYENFDALLQQHTPRRYLACTTKGQYRYIDIDYTPGDYLVFGSETKGLTKEIREARRARSIRIPMLPESRSLNLANSVGVIVYEALRQLEFPELT